MLSSVLLIDIFDGKGRPGPDLLNQGSCAICRAVVHHDPLEVDEGLILQRTEDSWQCGFAVVRGREHGKAIGVAGCHVRAPSPLFAKESTSRYAMHAIAEYTIVLAIEAPTMPIAGISTRFRMT